MHFGTASLQVHTSKPIFCVCACVLGRGVELYHDREKRDREMHTHTHAEMEKGKTANRSYLAKCSRWQSLHGL